jgi:hypothetical protein
MEKQDPGEHRLYFHATPAIRNNQLVNSGEFWDNSLLYFKIPTVNASMPLRLKWFEKLYGGHTQSNLAGMPYQWKSTEGQMGNIPYRPPTADYPRFWNLMAADFIMLRISPFTSFFEKEYPFLERAANDERTGRVLYRNPNAWKRFRLFGAYELIGDDEATLARLSDPSYDPETTLILNDEPEFDESSLPGPGAELGSVETLEHGYDRIGLKVISPTACLLYFAESYHPFWRAAIDGADTRVYRANLGMRAVYVPAGEHEVVMSYHSAPYTLGGWATVLSLLVLAAAVGWHAYRKDW